MARREGLWQQVGRELDEFLDGEFVVGMFKVGNYPKQLALPVGELPQRPAKKSASSLRWIASTGHLARFPLCALLDVSRGCE